MYVDKSLIVLFSSDLARFDDLNLPERGAIYVLFELELFKKSGDTNIRQTLAQWLKNDHKVKHYYSIDTRDSLKFIIPFYGELEEREIQTNLYMPSSEKQTTQYEPVKFTNYLGNGVDDYALRSKEIKRVIENGDMMDVIDAWTQRFLRENQYTGSLTEKQKDWFQKIEFQINDSLGL